MKTSTMLTALALAAVLTAPIVATDNEEKPSAEKVASTYFEAIVTGDVEKANDLSTAPFYFDGKEILKTIAEVKEKHRAILEKKGKRQVPKYAVKTMAEKSSLDSSIFPDHLVVRITIVGDDEHIDVYVTKGDTPKIIGFRD